MFVSYPVNPLLVRRYPVTSVSSGLSFAHVQNFPPDKTDRDARLMYGHYVAYTLHKLISRVSSVRGDEFCHRINKLCMFCPFSLRNKSVCRSDQAFTEQIPCFLDLQQEDFWEKYVERDMSLKDDRFLLNGI